MKSQSLWQKVKPRAFSPLKRNGEFDVVIVGAGITGLSAAYFLKQAGQKVCVLERDRLGFVDTGSTTAHLTFVTDRRPSELAKTFGDQAATLVLEAGRAAINAIESIVDAEHLDCEFRRVPGFLCAPFNNQKNDTKRLERDADVTHRLGFPCQYVERAPYVNRPGVRFADQAKFHPLKYLNGLADAVDGDGSKVFDRTAVSEVKDDPLCVIANGKQVRASNVVIATHVPLMGKAGTASAALLQSKIFPYTSYAIGATVPSGTIPEACYWDTSDPYYYLRVEAGKKQDYVIFGGEDHKTGQVANTEACFDRLAGALGRLVSSARIDRKWSGQVIETNDGLPYIGEMSGQFIATGFSGNGMTFGTVAGLMARDAVLQRDNPWRDLFSPGRKKLRGGTWSYLQENLDFPYYYVRDRLLGVESTTTRGLKAGEGKVLEIGGEKVACSRDEQGTLHKVSPFCTHMGCFVRWNLAEGTWDCPCHGSRFHPDGRVLAGPAEEPLAPVKRPSPRPAKRRAKKAASPKRSSSKPKRTKKSNARS